MFHDIYFIRVTFFYCCQIIEKDITPKCSDGEFRFLLPWEKFILGRKVFLLARFYDQVGRGKLDWHRSRLTRSAPLLRLLHMVVGVAVVVVVHLPHLQLVTSCTLWMGIGTQVVFALTCCSLLLCSWL